MIKFKSIKDLLNHPQLKVIECNNFHVPSVIVAEKEITEARARAVKKQTPMESATKKLEVRTRKEAEITFVNSLLPELKSFILSTKKELEAEINSESSVDDMYLEKEHLDIVEKLTAEIKDNNMENVTSSLYNDPLFSFLLGDKLEDHYNDIQCLEHEEYERGKHESDLSDQEDYENGEREYHQSLADENDAMDREDHESQNEPEFGHSVEKYLKARIGDDTYELSITDVEDEEGSVYKEHWKMNGELHRYGGGAAKIEKSMHYIPVEKHMDKGENIYCVKGKEIKRESNLTSDEQHESNVHSMLGFGVSRKELEDNYGM